MTLGDTIRIDYSGHWSHGRKFVLDCIGEVYGIACVGIRNVDGDRHWIPADRARVVGKRQAPPQGDLFAGVAA